MELAFIGSPADMLIVLAVALVVFGPKRLPEVGRQLGTLIRDLRKTMSQVTDTMNDVHSDIKGVWHEESRVPKKPEEIAEGTDLMRPYAPANPVDASVEKKDEQPIEAYGLTLTAVSPIEKAPVSIKADEDRPAMKMSSSTSGGAHE